MNCDICGREIYDRETIISLERTSMQVCKNCARFGKVAPQRVQSAKIQTTYQKRVENETEFIDDYFKVIQKTRNQKKLTMKAFAIMINERESVIARIERGQLIPTTQLAKKIERVLGISLFE